MPTTDRREPKVELPSAPCISEGRRTETATGRMGIRGLGDGGMPEQYGNARNDRSCIHVPAACYTVETANLLIAAGR
jgi:hypothetical protein